MGAASKWLGFRVLCPMPLWHVFILRSTVTISLVVIHVFMSSQSRVSSRVAVSANPGVQASYKLSPAVE